MNNWRESRACKKDEVDPDLFFPEGTTGPALIQAEAAKAVCARCVVQAECLAYALGYEDGKSIDYGILGGRDEDERDVIRRSPIPLSEEQLAAKVAAKRQAKNERRDASSKKTARQRQAAELELASQTA